MLIIDDFQVRTVCLTQDSYRAVAGCSDGRVYIYDVRAGKLSKTLSGQQGEVTAVRVTDKDDFLLTAGKYNFLTFCNITFCLYPATLRRQSSVVLSVQK